MMADQFSSSAPPKTPTPSSELLDAAALATTDVELLAASAKLLENYKIALDYHSIVVITDKRGTITYVNDAFCCISKYGRADLLGANHRLINSGYHKAGFFSTMWKTIASGEIWSGDICNRARDGGHYWMQTTIVPFKDKNGRIFQYVAIRTDITEKMQAKNALEDANKRLKALADELQTERKALSCKNIALNEIIFHVEEEKNLIKANMMTNLDTMIFPLLEAIKATAVGLDRKYITLALENLQDISKTLFKENIQVSTKLTPKELQICNMIKKSLTAKEIAAMLHLSPRTIDKHRENIRAKLQIKTKKVNLENYLIHHS